VCPSPNIIELSSTEELNWRGMWHVWGRREVHTGFKWGDMRARDHLEGLGVDRRIILNWIFNKYI